jgi:hypothetical protein
MALRLGKWSIILKTSIKLAECCLQLVELQWMLAEQHTISAEPYLKYAELYFILAEP